MPQHDTLIIKETHRGLLYEDGIFRDVLPAGRYEIPRPGSSLPTFLGPKNPVVEVVLVDVRGRDRSVVIQDLLTADGVTISATFSVQFEVRDPRAAVHQVRNYEERLNSDAQTAARRVLRGLSVEEIMGGRDEVGEEVLLRLRGVVEAFGVDVTGVDFKDLTIPDDLRKVMNRAVINRRLREARVALDPPDDDEPGIGADPGFEGDPALMIAKASFDRVAGDAREAEGRGGAHPIRPRGEARGPAVPPLSRKA